MVEVEGEYPEGIKLRDKMTNAFVTCVARIVPYRFLSSTYEPIDPSNIAGVPEGDINFSNQRSAEIGSGVEN